MRIKKIQMIFFLFLLFSIPVQASNGEQGNTQEQLLDSMELEKMQEAVNELLGEETFSVKKASKRHFQGKNLFPQSILGKSEKHFYINSFCRIRKFWFRLSFWYWLLLCFLILQECSEKEKREESVFTWYIFFCLPYS